MTMKLQDEKLKQFEKIWQAFDFSSNIISEFWAPWYCSQNNYKNSSGKTLAVFAVVTAYCKENEHV